jgi:hypothetical protein
MNGLRGRSLTRASGTLRLPRITAMGEAAAAREGKWRHGNDEANYGRQKNQIVDLTARPHTSYKQTKSARVGTCVATCKINGDGALQITRVTDSFPLYIYI